MNPRITQISLTPQKPIRRLRRFRRLGKDEAPVLERRASEIQQQPHFKARRLQVVENLRLFDWPE